MIKFLQARRAQRRLLFISLNALAMCALYFLVVLPIGQVLHDRDGEIATRSEALQRWRRIAAREPELKKVVDRSAAERSEFWAATNEGAANAELQARLKGLVEGAGTRIRSVQATPTRRRDGITYLGVRLDLFGEIAAVQRAIYAIETNKPFLFVTASLLKLGQPPSTPGRSVEPPIDAQLEISAPLEVGGS